MISTHPNGTPHQRKTNGEKVAESEERRKARGQKKITVWVPIEAEPDVKALAARLCAEHENARQRQRSLRLAAMAGRQ